MCINSILFKMDDIKRQLTLGLVLCIFVLINVPATNGYALKDAGECVYSGLHNYKLHSHALEFDEVALNIFRPAHLSAGQLKWSVFPRTTELLCLIMKVFNDEMHIIITLLITPQ